MKKIAVVAAAVAFMAGGASSAFAEEIVGTWKFDSGSLVKFSKSGSNYCGRMVSGEYKGQSIGCMAGTGGSYKGTIKALDEGGKEYTGKAKVRGSKLALSGCVLGGIICRTENLRKQ